MQLTLNIKNNSTFEKLIWFLEHLKSDGVEIVNPSNLKDKSNLIDTNKSETFQKLEKLKKEIGDDELINSIMYGMQKDYSYIPSNKSDKEIWYEEIGKKYE